MVWHVVVVGGKIDDLQRAVVCLYGNSTAAAQVVVETETVAPSCSWTLSVQAPKRRAPAAVIKHDAVNTFNQRRKLAPTLC